MFSIQYQNFCLLLLNKHREKNIETLTDGTICFMNNFVCKNVEEKIKNKQIKFLYFRHYYLLHNRNRNDLYFSMNYLHLKNIFQTNGQTTVNLFESKEFFFSLLQSTLSIVLVKTLGSDFSPIFVNVKAAGLKLLFRTLIFN